MINKDTIIMTLDDVRTFEYDPRGPNGKINWAFNNHEGYFTFLDQHGLIISREQLGKMVKHVQIEYDYEPIKVSPLNRIIERIKFWLGIW